MRPTSLVVPFVLAAAWLGCASSEAPNAPDSTGTETPRPAPTQAAPEAPPPAATSSAPAPAPSSPAAKPGPVTFSVLTYNVAGLPQGVSHSDPAVNTPQISPKLNPFDVVVVQEDFSYHTALISADTHPNRSTPETGGQGLGDGLNTLSRLPFAGFTRTAWSTCNGYFDQGGDCLTPKGYTRFILELGDGRTIDVYDVHFDAGRGDADAAARKAQVDQLTAEIAGASAGHAVIVAGDTNMKADDEATLQQLLTGSSLACACRTLGCDDPARHDRILFRSSANLKLTPKTYVVGSFVDASGNPLSDHDPVSVSFEAE